MDTELSLQCLARRCGGFRLFQRVRHRETESPSQELPYTGDRVARCGALWYLSEILKNQSSRSPSLPASAGAKEHACL